MEDGREMEDELDWISEQTVHKGVNTETKGGG
jgi:hypothetical protein